MTKSEYPKWIYGPKGASMIVKTATEQMQAGEDWFESPAHVPADEDDSVTQATPISGSHAIVAQTQALVEQYYAAPARLVVANVRKMETADDLHDVRALEENRPGGPRQSVLLAIAHQLAALTGAAVEKEEVHA